MSPKPSDLVACDVCHEKTQYRKSFLVFMKAKYWRASDGSDAQEKYLCANCGVTEFKKGRHSQWFFTPYAATKARKYERAAQKEKTA